MNVKDELVYYTKRILLNSKLKALRHRDDDISYAQFDEKKCIFVHIPKNAGISVAKSLLGKRIGHLTALDFRAVFGKRDFDEYFKFSFSRNPFTRLVSAYEFMMKGGYGEEDKEIVKIVKSYSGFDDFVLQYLTPASAKSIRHFRPQHYYLCDSNGAVLVDFVGKYERLADDFEYVRRKIGGNTALAKMNVTNAKKKSIDFYYHNPEVINKVISIYKRDFEMLGYSVDLPEDND